MLSCKDVALMLSQSVDGELQGNRKPALWLHLLFCRSCSRIRKQLIFLKEAGARVRAEKTPPPESSEEPGLSGAAKSAIKSRLRQANK